MVKKHPLFILTVILIAVILFSLVSGRYPVTIPEIFNAVYVKISGGELSYKQEEILFLLTDVRLPRILAAMLVGAALSSSGAVYQGMFLNPLVSPGILGVLSGASFGAALGIVIFQSWAATQILAFSFAIIAVMLALILAGAFPRSGILVLVLGGMISSSFFTALSSLLKYIADPTNQLPELVYWLMGTFSRANMDMIFSIGPVIIIGVFVLSFYGKIINAMSMGDDEAKALGVNVGITRLLLIGIATLISASTVVIAGTVQWVGVVIPHILRFFFGPDNRILMPASAIGGAAYVLLTDTVVRAAFSMELPIGIVTALVGLPLFVFAIYKNKGGWR